jgi:hypothetical protein
MLGVALIGKGLCILFYYLAYFFYIPPKKTEPENETETNGHINPVLLDNGDQIEKY